MIDAEAIPGKNQYEMLPIRKSSGSIRLEQRRPSHDIILLDRPEGTSSSAEVMLGGAAEGEHHEASHTRPPQLFTRAEEADLAGSPLGGRDLDLVFDASVGPYLEVKSFRLIAQRAVWSR